jgi:hypothetical protein
MKSGRSLPCSVEFSLNQMNRKMTVFWVVAPCSPGDPLLPYDGGSKDPETSVNSHRSTRTCHPEDSHLHCHRHENFSPPPHSVFMINFDIVLPSTPVYSKLYIFYIQAFRPKFCMHFSSLTSVSHVLSISCSCVILA